MKLGTAGLLTKCKSAALGAMFFLALLHSAFADESPFAFIYTTDTLPQGRGEIEQWLTYRTQQKQGTYNAIEGRTELEFGITNDFQLAFYVNYGWAEAFHNGVDGKTAPPEFFASDNPGPDERYNRTKLTGFSVEAIYRVLSPYTSPVGLAFYLEPSWGQDFFEIESKILLQRNFLDDRLVLAFNLVHAPEFRLIPAEGGGRVWEQETEIQLDSGVAYRVASGWFAGVELLNEMQYADYLDFAHIKNNAYYFGPTIHYASQSFWVTASVMAQMPWAGSYADTDPGAYKDGYVYDHNYERYRMRVRAGWVF